MAPNKKKGRNNNKKKNSAKRQSVKAAAPSNERIENVPTFHAHGNAIRQDASPYERYKQCTVAFRDWLIEQNFQVKKVTDLKHAVDEIHLQSMGYLDSDFIKTNVPIVISHEVMANLRECIELREQVSDMYRESPDEGHAYMIDTLKYCCRTLSFSKNMVRVAVADRPPTKNDTIGGRFHALLEVDEDEQEEVESDMESIRSKAYVHTAIAEAPSEPEYEYTMDDLINGDDRYQACSFMRTMNDLMDLVEQHYGLLKKALRGEAKHDTTSPIQLMMQCAVVVNMTTETICTAEAALAADHPHLSSFYAVLALIFLYPIIADIEKEIGPNVTSDRPTIAKRFAGDILECSFRNKGDPIKVKSIVNKFSKNAGIPVSTAEKFARGINLVTNLEVQWACEGEGNASLLQLASSLGLKPHSWLDDRFPSLGGDHAFLNTHRLVQNVMDIVTPAKLVPKPGFFGPAWDENSRPANQIRGDMDQLFAGDILPELLEWAKHQPVSILPNRQELIPVLDLLSKHVQNTKAPVQASLTFGLHSILVSMFLLQGDGDVNRLEVSTRQSFNRLFEQLDKDSKSSRPQPPTFHHNMNMFIPLRNLRSTKMIELTPGEMNAFWNPVIGGEFLLYATYITSIGLGSVTVDTLGQLRFTLHLYNALRKCMLIPEIEFLSNLDTIFGNCKAIWHAGRQVEKGGFAKHFYLAWGHSLQEATNMAQASPNFDDKKKNASRKLNAILPEEFSHSYRRLVKRDFSKDTDDYSVTNATNQQRKSHENLFSVISRINMTRDSMDDDETTVIPTNFTRVGCLLIDFVCGLSNALGWDDDFDPLVATCPDEVRLGNRVSGRRARAGGFEASDTNLKWQALALAIGHLLQGLDHDGEGGARLGIGRDAAAFMNEYFGGIAPESFSFLCKVSEKTPQSTNPLLGSYSPGRTGRTPRDPLAAFWHFKYSKRGERVMRLVKPGKRTPFVLSTSQEDGANNAVTPYTEVGSKQQSQSNGKYRHIADYSLDELIALGWDGAKYISKGNHVAKNLWCPFICGYDSDDDNRYEPINVEAGRRAGTIGLTREEGSLYMNIPMQGVVQLNSN